MSKSVPEEGYYEISGRTQSRFTVQVKATSLDEAITKFRNGDITSMDIDGLAVGDQRTVVCLDEVTGKHYRATMYMGQMFSSMDKLREEGFVDQHHLTVDHIGRGYDRPITEDDDWQLENMQDEFDDEED